MRFSEREILSSKYKFLNYVYMPLNSFLIEYPCPYNLNYFWNFGFMAGIFLAIQLVTGIFLAMFYIPNVDLAYLSVDYIMRDIYSGWVIRFLHSNGASMFFVAVYFHIFKGIYYGSYQYPRHFVWTIGVIIYILMMGTAFLGYVLPWGQMSFWAATVITNFLTVIPYFGVDILYWIWGGFSINNATLNRFFSLHYLLPFVILALVMIHLIVLHDVKGNNPLGIVTFKMDKISFYPYFLFKDFFGLMIFFFIYLIFIFFFPEFLSHSDNYIEANPLVTPNHIVPEWYFLPFYAILRSILQKEQGIIIMFVSMLVFLLLPLITFNDQTKSNIFKPLHRKIFWFFVLNLFFLGFLGSAFAVSPYIELGLMATHFHLFYFFIILPILSSIEWSFSQISVIRKFVLNFHLLLKF